MLTGKTTAGFEYTIDEASMNNMELIDALADLENGDILSVSKVVTLMLGKEQKKRLYDFLRLDNGAVPVDAVSNAVVEILQTNTTTKN